MLSEHRVEVLEHTMLELMRAVNGLIGTLEAARIERDGMLRIQGDSPAMDALREARSAMDNAVRVIAEKV